MTFHIPKSALIWGAVIIAFVAIKWGQISGEDEKRDSGVPALSSDVLEQMQPRPLLEKYEASTLVRDFYASIDDDDFSSAWKPLSSEVRNELQGFDTWRQGHEFNVATEVEDVWIEKTSRLGAVAHIALKAVDVDACGDRITQNFEGSWLVAESQNQMTLSNPDIQKTSGAKPISDESSCPVEAPPVAPSTPEPEPYVPPETYSQPSEPTDPYDVPYDLDCGDVSETDIDVSGGDPHGFDADGDGVGCESY